jgi:cytochrome c oxidase cbb3-type subunit 3
VSAPRPVAVASLALAAALACQREERTFSDVAAASRRQEPPPRSSNRPGDHVPPRDPGAAGPPILSRGDSGPANAYDLSQGQLLYQKFNCSGCHALAGGGSIGPPLMDATWLYGARPEDVYRSIVEGRPNGMPAFGGKIPEAQVWQLVAYVRSLSGLAPLDARPSRSDSISTGSPPSMRDPLPPRAPAQRPSGELP